MANIFGNSQPAVSPFQGQKPVSPQVKPPNFQKLDGSNVYVPPPSTGAMQQMAAMGVKAKTPETNVSKPSTVIPSAQAAAPKPVGNPSIQGNAVIPTAPPGTPAPTPAPGAAGTTPSPYQGGLYGQMINKLSGFDPFANPQVGDAYKRAQDINAQIASSKKNEANAVATNNLNPIPIGDQQGRARVLRDQYLQQQSALSSELQGQASIYGAGFTGTGQQATALANATSQVPEALRYGAYGGNGLDPQSQASQLAQLVTSGQMSLPDAESQMQAYGLIGSPTLRNAILSTNPQFNFAQAQTLSTTQGQVAPQLNMAQAALTNLTNTFAAIPGWQKSGIPALNSLANMFSATTGIGIGTETQKQNAIKEARTQVANALGVMTNTTPTAWTTTVESWFPENATPEQIEAGLEQFNNLAKNRQAIYGTPGAVQPFTPDMVNQNATGNSLYNF